MKAFNFSSEKIPSEITYKIPDASPEAERKTVSFRPQQGSSFSDTTNSTIQIYIPPANFLDTFKSYLKFRHSASGTNVYAVSPVAQSLFRRVRIIDAGSNQVITDIDYHNVLYRTKADVSDSVDLRGSPLNVLQGYWVDTTQAKAWAAGKTYILPLTFGFFKNNKYIPMKYTQGIYLEFVCDSSANVHITSSGSSSYTIDQVEFIGDLVSFVPDLENEIGKLVASKGLKMYYDDFNHHFSTYTVANQTLFVSDNSKSVKTLITVLRESANINNDSVDSLGTRSQGNTILTYQIKSGSKMYPSNPIDLSTGGAMAFAEMSKAMNSNVNGVITQATWNKAFGGSGTQFFIGQNFETVDSLLSGDASISNEHKNIELTLTASNNPSPTTVNSWIHCDAFLTISGDGLSVIR